MMVFRSKDASAPSQVINRTPVKATRARFKRREDTPAPPTKGEGRKRLDLSPFPEDKQLRKRIDFGNKDSPNLEAPKCKGAIFPATSIHGSGGSSTQMVLEAEGVPKEVNQEMRRVCYNSSIGDEISPESGEAAGDEEDVGRDEDNLLHQPWSKQEDPNNANGVLVGEIVNLPKMNLKTNLLLESGLESSHLEESHGALAVGDHMEPKNDNILLLAHLNSADMFDSMVAQPLLAGGLPEADQMVVDPAKRLISASDPPLMTLMKSSPNPGEPAKAMAPQPPYTGNRTVEGLLVTEPPTPHPSEEDNNSPGPPHPSESPNRSHA